MPSRQSQLAVGMAAALLGLALATAGLLVGVWLVFYALLSVFGVGAAASVAAGVTALVLPSIGYLEYRQIRTIERVADAERVTRETEPALYDLVTRVAAQLDVPVPTVAVSERRTPEALAVGFRPENIHLVLSRGTLEALSGPAELEAVVAHELSHVKNRDAMVMTVVSLPVVLADGLRSRIAAVESPGWTLVVLIPLGVVSTAVWVVGKAITARLSRVREHTADRVAAEVTGSPAALASALGQLDRDIAATPARDLREASGISSLSILPLEPEELEKVMLGPDGDREPSYWWLRTRLHALERWLFRTHPPTAERIESLSTLERSRE
ncbi:M48 family metalloprotease [Halobaculum lipolyticum]|uniref:M48 family metalloprotease n=1 Tax=Halobaculum lipolyticum TaxID=3032001 RepID=A0ABD5WCY8_9EURY|nr:M48 family metalloprotease [Halobaculum sp. DT31]